MSQGELGQSGDIPNSEFAHDPLPVSDDTGIFQVEMICDLFGGKTLRDEGEHFGFSRRELGQQTGAALDHQIVILLQNLGCFRAVKIFTSSQRFNRPKKFLRLAVFQKIPSGSETDHLQDVFLVFMHGEDEHLDFRKLCHQQLARGQTVQMGHVDVQEDQVRMKLPREFHRLQTISSLAHDFNIWAEFEQSADSFAKQRVIIHEQNLDFRIWGGGPARLSLVFSFAHFHMLTVEKQKDVNSIFQILIMPRRLVNSAETVPPMDSDPHVQGGKLLNPRISGKNWFETIFSRGSAGLLAKCVVSRKISDKLRGEDFGQTVLGQSLARRRLRPVDALGGFGLLGRFDVLDASRLA
jgi:hypothetical protein